MKSLEEAMYVASCTLFHLRIKSHFVHLNLVGENFWQYHKMLDKIYKDLNENFDSISEQIRTLKLFAPASLMSFQKYSVIEDLNQVREARSMLYELYLDFDKLIDSVTEANSFAEGHIGLQNFLQGLAEGLEKWRWMLRVTVEKK